jgi:RNA polymerase sigma-70 factor, ECF subfamily
MNPFKEQAEHDTQNAELADRCRNGDQSAFRTLMNLHSEYAYAVAYRLLRNEDPAHEVVHEAFIRVWKNLHRYRKEIKFTTWLYSVVVNLCYDRIRSDYRRRSRFGLIPPEPDFDGCSSDPDPYMSTEQNDLRDRIVAVARTLPPKEYWVWNLRDLNDFELPEIARMTRLSEDSVKVYLCNARKRIRLALRSLGETRP